MTMLVKFDVSSLRETAASEYATRFLFGGIVTVFAGLIADKFGPAIGGLFLAFPAIFPASVSLIDKHQREAKQRAGLDGTIRGRRAAGVDAAGTAMGCFGLASFGVTAWRLLPLLPLWMTLASATAVWAIVSLTAWLLCRRIR